MMISAGWYKPVRRRDSRSRGKQAMSLAPAPRWTAGSQRSRERRSSWRFSYDVPHPHPELAGVVPDRAPRLRLRLKYLLAMEFMPATADLRKRYGFIAALYGRIARRRSCGWFAGFDRLAALLGLNRHGGLAHPARPHRLAHERADSGRMRPAPRRDEIHLAPEFGGDQRSSPPPSND